MYVRKNLFDIIYILNSEFSVLNHSLRSISKNSI